MLENLCKKRIKNMGQNMDYSKLIARLHGEKIIQIAIWIAI